MSVLATICLALPQAVPPQEPRSEVAADAAGFTIDLRHRGVRKWKVSLPDEQWRPVGTAFSLAKTHGFDFKTKIEGTRLLVDTDGDGETDVSAEGKTAFLTLRGKTSDGKPLAYSVRLANEKGWKFAPGGYLEGKIEGTRVRLIDQNNNGVFGEVGRDALIVGTGKTATFFSKVINVGGDLYEIDVANGATELTCTRYDGPSGKLHLTCTTQGKVMAAVVRSTDRRYSFDVSLAKDGMQVPVGAYRLMKGELGLGKSRVTMQTGQSKPITVARDQTKQVCWGGPVRAEFDYQRRDGKLHLSPDNVWLYGAAGELYTGWVPLGASPKFTITDDKTGKEVAQAHFPGTC
jgi:hypothetical protein